MTGPVQWLADRLVGLMWVIDEALADLGTDDDDGPQT